MASVFSELKATAFAAAHSCAAVAALSKVSLIPSSVASSVVQATSSTKDRVLTPGTRSSTCPNSPDRYTVNRIGEAGEPYGMPVSTS